MKFEYKSRIANGSDFAPIHSQEYCKFKKKKTKNGYYGVFAIEYIRKGSIIGKTGGVVFSSMADVPEKYDYSVLIAENLYLGPEDYENMETLCFVNHSCDSNTGRLGGSILFAKRNIAPNEELTIDYAPLGSGMTPAFKMECRCGAKKCRGFVSSDDWKIPGLARKLWMEWLPFIQRKLVKNGIVK